jgi:glycosyltransferase involved in cell wall biosynthesis
MALQSLARTNLRVDANASKVRLPESLAKNRSSQEPRVAIVHDYLTQRGGAERVVLSLTDAFPDAPVHCSLYLPDGTFPDFAQMDVRPSPLNRVALLRQNHRIAFPVLAWTFSHLEIEADVTVCSSSGWAHGVKSTGRKVVFCHNPARWLYQPQQYLGSMAGPAAVALGPAFAGLRHWDRKSAATADRYIANSRAVAARIKTAYGFDSDVVFPPPALDPTGPEAPLDGVEPGFLLCVTRLLPYKNVDAVTRAFALLPGERLVVVGTGPVAANLKKSAPANVRFVGSVNDQQLRWLYANSLGVIAAAYEDFGLVPLEAASFGKPTAALRWGGYLDSVDEGISGLFFDQPDPDSIAQAVFLLQRRSWSSSVAMAHAERFGRPAFIRRLQGIVKEVA